MSHTQHARRLSETSLRQAADDAQFWSRELDRLKSSTDEDRLVSSYDSMTSEGSLSAAGPSQAIPTAESAQTTQMLQQLTAQLDAIRQTLEKILSKPGSVVLD